MREVIYRDAGVKRTTIPVRIDKALYARVAELAAREGRKVRAQLERLAEQALAQQPVLEVRKGGRR
jgi:hypothetical protein